MAAASLENRSAPSGGNIEGVHHRVRVAHGEVVQFDLEDAILCELLRADEREALSGKEEDLQRPRRCIGEEYFVHDRCELRVRRVSIIENYDSGQIRKVPP